MNSKILLISNLKRTVNKNKKAILDSARSKIKSLDLQINDQYTGYETMSVYLYPNATINRITSASTFFNILFYIDEKFGEDTRVSDNILPVSLLEEIWNEKSNNDKRDKIYQGVQSLKSIILDNKSGYFIEKTKESLFNHFRHSFNPTPYKTVEEYINTRLYFSGMYLAIDFIEHVHELYLTPEVLERIAGIKVLQRLCAEIGALSNDLFSFPKESHSKFNLINVLLLTKTASNREDALKIGIDIVNKRYIEFLSACKLINQSLSTQDETLISNYIKALNDIISASYHWQFSTMRYKNPAHFFEDMR